MTVGTGFGGGGGGAAILDSGTSLETELFLGVGVLLRTMS